MSQETERDVIRQRLNSSWGSTTAISWDGFNGKPFSRQEGVEFIRPRIEDGRSEWVGISAALRKERKFGTLLIEVMVPMGTGDERGNHLCDLLIEAFKAYTSGSVRFDERAFSLDMGADAPFYRWHVLAPYYREETVTI